MSKIVFVPDVHLQEQSPRSRKDAYPTTILEKLDFIVNYVNDNKATCIFLGDLFNAVNMPMNYFYRVVDEFKKFNETPYIIVGNHDYPRDNDSLLPRTPLGLLHNIGLINYFDNGYLDIDNVEVRGFNYWEDMNIKAKDTGKKHICVAHAFYEDNFAQTHNLHYKDCQDLGYNYYILGHDHTPYEDVETPDYKVIRIGSLSRGTAADKQLTRDKVYILEYDIDLDIFNKVSVPCLPAKDVFNDSIFIRKENKLDTKKILDNLVFTSNDSIYDVLDRAEQTDEIKQIVEQYLQAAGIFRINK